MRAISTGAVRCSVFQILSGIVGGASVQNYDCAHGPDYYQVRNVASHDHLNVRAGPFSRSARVRGHSVQWNLDQMYRVMQRSLVQGGLVWDRWMGQYEISGRVARPFCPIWPYRIMFLDLCFGGQFLICINFRFGLSDNFDRV